MKVYKTTDRFDLKSVFLPKKQRTLPKFFNYNKLAYLAYRLYGAACETEIEYVVIHSEIYSVSLDIRKLMKKNK